MPWFYQWVRCQHFIIFYVLQPTRRNLFNFLPRPTSISIQGDSMICCYRSQKASVKKKKIDNDNILNSKIKLLSYFRKGSNPEGDQATCRKAVLRGSSTVRVADSVLSIKTSWISSILISRFNATRWLPNQ